jgi:serine protease Do
MPLPYLSGLLLSSLLASADSPQPSLFAARGTSHQNFWTDATSAAKAKIPVVPSLAPLVRQVEPAVLVIYTQTPFALVENEMPPGQVPDDHPDILDGQGAGFIVSADGYALTNQHVVENAVRITARVGNGAEEVAVTVIGTDAKTDVALIKLGGSRTDWPVLALGNSDALAVGDYVVAIGSPFGLAQSVSAGILSARGRRDIAPSGRQGLYDFLQTDASINPGNSGGPLLDLRGVVIGINSAVNTAGSGIGFAIPINQVKRMLPQLRITGRIERSWIGVAIQRVSPELREGLQLKTTTGALIREVVRGGPAAVAGIQPGDVVTQFDGQNIIESGELPLLAGDAGINKTVTLELVRAGVVRTLPLTLGAHPDNMAEIERAALQRKRIDQELAKRTPGEGKLGLSFVTLDAGEKARLKLAKDARGVRVTRVRLGSPCHEAGLVADDVIIELNGTPVDDADKMASLVGASRPGSLLRLLVLRGDARVFVPVVQPRPSP